MVTILSNVNALAASRQIGVTKVDLNRTITRLTTGKRVNTASDDAASLDAGNTAMAASRSAAASVYKSQANYFVALNADGANQQLTELAYKQAELEGGGNSGLQEYSDLGTTTGMGTNSSASLAKIALSQKTNAASMSAALSTANLSAITSETQLGIADAYLGADMGAEMANLTKYQIMMQAGTSALNNANQSAQTVLGLFR